MRTVHSWLLAVVAFSGVFSAGCAHSAGAPAQLSATDRQKQIEMSRQAEINFKSDQINHSNLPPEQKQRLLDQIRSGAGK